MPARLYVVDREGKVAFKSGRGPFGFSPPELEQALAMSLLEAELAQDDGAPARPAASAPVPAVVPSPAPSAAPITAPVPVPVPASKQSSL
jgi:hypothetical protein